MKITVIIPYRNASKYIGRCLASLIQQDGDLQVITVNDNGSHDTEDYQIAENAQVDVRFLNIDNERTPGVSGARNTGLIYADGDWITFLDADDTWLPDAMDQLYQAIASAPADTDIIQLNHLRHYVESDKTALKFDNQGGTYTPQGMPKQWFAVWNKLINARHLIEETSLEFKEGLQYGEDELFVLQALDIANGHKIHHAAHDTIALKRYFDNKQSLSRIRTREDLISHIRATEDALFTIHSSEVRDLARRTIAEHWQTPTFIQAFSGEIL